MRRVFGRNEQGSFSNTHCLSGVLEEERAKAHSSEQFSFRLANVQARHFERAQGDHRERRAVRYPGSKRNAYGRDFPGVFEEFGSRREEYPDFLRIPERLVRSEEHTSELQSHV